MTSTNQQEARDIARRWLELRRVVAVADPLGRLAPLLDNLRAIPAPGHDDRERLFSWVRDTMATVELSRNPDDWLPASTYLASIVGERLGLFEGARAARPYDDLMREAKDLCEAAGWPS